MNEKNISILTRRDFLRRAACAAVGTAAMTSAIRDLRFMNAAIADQSVPTDYKALVCIFLAGGNDSNNMIIPTANSEYGNYASIRGANLALPQSSLLNLQIPGTGSGYGQPCSRRPEQTNTFTPTPPGTISACIPPAPSWRSFSTKAKLAAILFNTGTLIYPITGRRQYRGSSS